MIPLRLPLYIRRIPCCGKTFRIEAFLLCFIHYTQQYPLAFYHICHPVWVSTSKFVRWETKMEKKVLGTFRFCSLSLPSRNTLHTDQVAFASPFKNSPHNVSCTGFTQFKSAEIKTQKLLGDYSSENSEYNRRELRTLEIYFLESV